MPDPLVVLGVSYAGKEGVKVAAELIRDVLGPSAKALGKGIAAPIEAWATQRTERALTVVMNAVQMVEAAGYKPVAVPGRILWPILEKSSVEEELDLQQRWAALLANASINPEGVSPAFAHILGQLAPLDANLLEWMLNQSPYRTEPPSGSYETVTAERIMTEMQLSADALVVVLANLDRNNLILAPDEFSDPRQTIEHRFQHTAISTYGIAFLRACRPPRAIH